MSKGDKDRLLFPSMGEPTLFMFRRSTPNICLGNIHLPTENVLLSYSPKSRFFGVSVVNVPVVVCVCVWGGGGGGGGGGGEVFICSGWNLMVL